MVKNLPANAGDTGLILGWEDTHGEGKGSPLQYSGLENPMDCITWTAAHQRRLTGCSLWVAGRFGHNLVTKQPQRQPSAILV